MKVDTSQNLKCFSKLHNQFLVKSAVFISELKTKKEGFIICYEIQRNTLMMEDDEKDLLKKKIEDSKEGKLKLEQEIIKLNSHIYELFQERLAYEENEDKLLKLFDAGEIVKEGIRLKDNYNL